MATNGSRQPPALPPRTLNVQKFAESRSSELKTLHSIVANRLNNDFRSRRNKRRRTTGHDNRIMKGRCRKKHKSGVVDAGSDVGLEEDEKKSTPSRRIRRKLELRQNPEIGFSTSGDGTKRLRTHVWHAKRFTMTKLWGFHLPLGVHGRGRGSRALLKKLENGVLIHDASYYGAVQLEGPEDSLLAILSTVFVSPSSARSEDISHSVLSGIIYGNAMLHHVGAPFSSPIAPVTYMWRPSHQQHIGVDAESSNPDGSDEPQKIDKCSSSRQLWVWIHAASFKEGHNALEFACRKQMDETGILITCISLEGQLAKMEVMGSRACHLLQMMLHAVTCSSDNSWKVEKCSVNEANGESQLPNISILDSEDHIYSSAIISLKVVDPRALTEKRAAVIPKAKSSSHERNDEIDGPMDLTDDPNKKAESLWSKPEEISDMSECIDLWDVNNGIDPPIEESVICMEKQHRRLDFFCLGNKNSGAANISSKGQSSRYCPIMLLKNENQKGSVVRWSIILPLSWVKAFWVPLVSNGAHAIGLREKHWIACAGGLPYFPSDFPDCRAYSCFMVAEAAARDQKDKLRPPAVRSFNVPIPPPWNCVRLALDQISSTVGDAQGCVQELYATNKVDDNSLTKSDSEKCETAALGLHVVSFEGFVARTTYILSEFLNNINGDHLLLFPNMPDGNKCMSKFMKDEGKVSCDQNRAISLIKYDSRPCFLRVLLHAYKNGVFEEGAVVCAPHFTDIALCMSRPGSSDGEILVPQSALRSLFVQQTSGKWELQIPDDPVARKSHRWPIGFVTTGFVRGSKKPVASAICDAVCLARLREEQWNSMPVKQRKKEIFVMVRNLRSTAYRLALATIVLERWDEDLEYM